MFGVEVERTVTVFMFNLVPCGEFWSPYCQRCSEEEDRREEESDSESHRHL